MIGAYWPAFDGAFIVGDDSVITGNALLTAEDGLYRIWFTMESQQYRPIAYTAYRLQYHLWGPNPLGYHVVSVLLHAARGASRLLVQRSIGKRR